MRSRRNSRHLPVPAHRAWPSRVSASACRPKILAGRIHQGALGSRLRVWCNNESHAVRRTADRLDRGAIPAHSMWPAEMLQERAGPRQARKKQNSPRLPMLEFVGEDVDASVTLQPYERCRWISGAARRYLVEVRPDHRRVPVVVRRARHDAKPTCLMTRQNCERRVLYPLAEPQRSATHPIGSPSSGAASAYAESIRRSRCNASRSS